MTPCVEWPGKLTQSGYGERVTRGGVRKAPHIWAWIDATGITPGPGICVCHKCDNRACINPEHLFLGTKGDNNRDRHSKGRTNKGVDRPDAKLTEADVRKIRQLYDTGLFSQRALARKFDVSQPLIGYVVRRENWTHVC